MRRAASVAALLAAAAAAVLASLLHDDDGNERVVRPRPATIVVRPDTPLESFVGLPSADALPHGLTSRLISGGRGATFGVARATVGRAGLQGALVEWRTPDGVPHVVFWVKDRTRRWRATRVPIRNDVRYTHHLVLGARDVTGDGRDELLVDDVIGNHGCGTKSIYRWTPERLVRIFELTACERYWEVATGRLYVGQGIYRAGDSVCCPRYWNVTSFRFDGRRLVPDNARLIKTRA